MKTDNEYFNDYWEATHIMKGDIPVRDHNVDLRNEFIKVMESYASERERETAIEFAFDELGYNDISNSLLYPEIRKKLGEHFDEWKAK